LRARFTFKTFTRGYDLAAPVSAAGVQSFQGIASFDGDDFPVSGTRSTTVTVWTSARLEGGGPAFTLGARRTLPNRGQHEFVRLATAANHDHERRRRPVFQPAHPTQSPHRFFHARRLP